MEKKILKDDALYDQLKEEALAKPNSKDLETDEEFERMAKKALMELGLTEDEAERELEDFNK